VLSNVQKKQKTRNWASKSSISKVKGYIKPQNKIW